MEESKIMSVEDFMYMFVAVNYLRDNKCFNIDLLKNYLKKIFKKEVSDENYQISFDLLDKEIDCALIKMMNEKIIGKMVDYEYLVTIENKIPAMNILKNNFQHLGIMTKFVNDFLCYNYVVDKDDYQLTTSDESFVLDDGFVKRKIKKETV